MCDCCGRLHALSSATVCKQKKSAVSANKKQLQKVLPKSEDFPAVHIPLLLFRCPISPLAKFPCKLYRKFLHSVLIKNDTGREFCICDNHTESEDEWG